MLFYITIFGFISNSVLKDYPLLKNFGLLTSRIVPFKFPEKIDPI